MSINQLKQVVESPTTPIGPSTDWNAIEGQVGFTFPSDFRQLVSCYGTGYFVDPGRVSIQIDSPVSDGYFERVMDSCELFENLRDIGVQLPYNFFPAKPGLFPWGHDDNGWNFFWLIEGDCERWPIMCANSREMVFSRFDLPATTFLAKSFRRELACPAWNSPEFFSGPKKVIFVPSTD